MVHTLFPWQGHLSFIFPFHNIRALYIVPEYHERSLKERWLRHGKSVSGPPPLLKKEPPPTKFNLSYPIWKLCLWRLGLAKLSTEVISWVEVVPILSFQQPFGQLWRFQPLFARFWRALKDFRSRFTSPSCPLSKSTKKEKKKSIEINLNNNQFLSPAHFGFNPVDTIRDKMRRANGYKLSF